MTSGSGGAIEFGERVLSLLEQGRFTATYKYAVLLALIDVCMETTDDAGAGPSSVAVADLAEKTAELYWRQTEPFAPLTGEGEAMVLKQNMTGQAEMVSMVERYRARVLGGRGGQLSLARAKDPAAYVRLIDGLEWKLAQMPLPRLQLVGRTRTEFLYSIDWDERVTRSSYFEGNPRVLRMKKGASDHLIRLSGLLRPLIQRDWATWMARHKTNRTLIKDAYLEEFLFGASRVSLERLRDGLSEIQARHCFYCGQPARTGEIDHFIPWSRSADNGIENLVLACRACNNSKRNHLAAGRHVVRWTKRFDPTGAPGQELADIADEVAWESDPARTLSVARALYTRLPGDVLLWNSSVSAVPASKDSARVRAALRG